MVVEAGVDVNGEGATIDWAVFAVDGEEVAVGVRTRVTEDT